MPAMPALPAVQVESSVDGGRLETCNLVSGSSSADDLRDELLVVGFNIGQGSCDQHVLDEGKTMSRGGNDTVEANTAVGADHPSSISIG